MLVGAGSASATTFTTVGEQAFVVPAGAHRVHVDLVGGAGGAGTNGAAGGLGGTASGELDVTPGETLFVEVGSAGGEGSNETGGAGGANGGGTGGGGGNHAGVAAGGGGGASDVRTLIAASPGSLASRLIVAGGGGGGDGEGTLKSLDSGANASANPGGATTPNGPQGGSANATMGGAGGELIPAAPAGTEGKGGNGAANSFLPAGGGGGGGEFGGGGGGGNGAQFAPSSAGGGGGGSDFLAASVIAGSEGVETGRPAPSVTITVVPVAFAQLTPSAQAFGPVTTGTVGAAESITVTNAGSAPLSVTGASLSGTAPGDFAVSSSGCAAPVAPGGSCALSVRFAPKATGARSATLTLSSNSTQAPSVSLTGVGVAPLAPGLGRAPGGVPRLGQLRGKPTAFQAATRGGSIAGHGGMLVSYTDSAASLTTFTVKRSVPGVRAGGRCVAATHGKKGRRCTRLVTIGSFEFHDRVGTEKFHFTGRLRRRKLKPGHYMLVAVPRAAGHAGGSRSLGFQILPAA